MFIYFCMFVTILYVFAGYGGPTKSNKSNVQAVDPKKSTKTMYRIYGPKQINETTTMFQDMDPQKSTTNNVHDTDPKIWSSNHRLLERSAAEAVANMGMLKCCNDEHGEMPHPSAPS